MSHSKLSVSEGKDYVSSAVWYKHKHKQEQLSMPGLTCWQKQSPDCSIISLMTAITSWQSTPQHSLDIHLDVTYIQCMYDPDVTTPSPTVCHKASNPDKVWVCRLLLSMKNVHEVQERLTSFTTLA